MAPTNENQEKGLLRTLFSFPSPVNEVAARLVAGMVMALSLAVLLTDQWWLMFVLAYGFLARVATGPTLSPMGLLATRVSVRAALLLAAALLTPPQAIYMRVARRKKAVE